MFRSLVLRHPGPLALLLLPFCLLLLPRALAEEVLREGSPVERLSVLFYLTAAGVALFRSVWTRQLAWLAGGLLLLLAGLREMDFHDRFTSQGITRLRFYTSVETPLGEKGLVVLFLLVTLALLFQLVRERWMAWREGSAPPALFLLGVALLALGQFLDRLVRWMVYDWGWPAASALPFLAFTLEETTECIAPLLFLWVLLPDSLCGPATHRTLLSSLRSARRS